MSLALAACGGGAGGSSVRPPVNSATGANASGPVGTASVQLAINVPTSTISAATKSALIAVGGTSTVLQCAATCSGSLLVPLGVQTFVASLFDAPNATGNMLATGQTTATIASGQNNVVNIAFGGVVKTVVVSLAPSSLSDGAPATIAVSVVAKDAAGFNIVGSDPYPALIALSNDDTSGATSLSTTSVTAPSTSVTLSYNGSASVSTVNITASIADKSVNVQAGTLKVRHPSPAPAPTPSPTPAPTPVPTIAQSSATLVNGVAWPASFRPYGASSFWNRPMSNLTSPILYANSDTIIKNVEANDPGPDVTTSEYGAGYADGHPIVFASSSDPVVNVKCTLYCSNPNIPATIHLPAKARPASAGDGHLGVVQPDGTEVDFWAVSPNQPQYVSDWTNGATISAAGAAGCGNFYTGPGSTIYATTVGGACLAAGVVRYNEIVSGTINHALFMTTSCFQANTYVYPATQNGDVNCTGTNAPLGAHIWLDLSDAQVNALPLAAWEKTLLRAMHNYGGYLMDSGGSPTQYANGYTAFAHIEDDGQYSAFGNASPWAAWAQSQGWNPTAIPAASAGYISATRWISPNSPWNPLASVGGWAQHLHVVDPCYAQGAC